MNDVTQDIIEPTWVNGVKKVGVKQFHGSATVSSGNAVFYLTDNGASNGNAIFTNVYTESIQVFAPSTTDTFVMSFTVASDKKSLTATVSRLGSVVVGVIQMVTAANGTTVYLSVKGD